MSNETEIEEEIARLRDAFENIRRDVEAQLEALDLEEDEEELKKKRGDILNKSLVLMVETIRDTKNKVLIESVDKCLDLVDKLRVAFSPVVVKVTVTNGQARVNLPKNVALKLDLLKEDGEPGEVRYLLLSSNRPRPGIILTPVEMTEVEEKTQEVH